MNQSDSRTESRIGLIAEVGSAQGDLTSLLRINEEIRLSS